MKPRLGIVLIGPQGSGKSTLAGRILADHGLISESQRQKCEENPENYAQLFDTLVEDREHGFTVNTKTKKIVTKNYIIYLTDTPGHIDYVGNLSRGIGVADYCIFVAPSSGSRMDDSDKSEGSILQSLLHAFALGLRQFIVVFNKVDGNGDEFKANYSSYVSLMENWMTKVGVKPVNPYWTESFIPISALDGNNILERCDHYSWYNGPSLFEAIDSLKPPHRPMSEPLRISIQGADKVSGVGTVPYGHVKSGVLKPGMVLKFAPYGLTATVRSIESFYDSISEAIPGDFVGFCIGDVPLHEIRREKIAGDMRNDPPRCVESFLAHISILDRPGNIKAGYTPVFEFVNCQVPCKLLKLLRKVDKKTGKDLEEEPQSLMSGDAAFVTVVPQVPLCVDTFQNYPFLGRFAIRDLKRVVGIGVIKEVAFKQT